jgi:TldD protein
MREKIKNLVRHARIPFLEVRLEERQGVDIQYVGKELETLNQYIDIGGNVRAFCKGVWSFASFNDFDELESHISFVIREARQSGRGIGKRLAKSEPYVDEVTVKQKDDPRKISIDDKINTVKGYNSRILRSKKIQSSRTTYSDTFVRKFYINSDGADIVEEKVYTGISFTAIAKDGMNIQMMKRAHASTQGFDSVKGREASVEEVKKDAIDMLKAEKVQAGVYTVVVDPILAGVFAHEAFGHLSEADFISSNKKVQEIMKIGREFGNTHLTIVDDGSMKSERGSFAYDDEGVPSQKNYLIKEGKLVGRLHSRETAIKMGEETTGNARALDYRFPPIVRMSNTYIDKGTLSFKELIKDIDTGIYAVDALGGNTQLEMFTFSSAKAYMIKKGKVGKMVRDVVLSGNVFETMKNIDGIGNDLSIHGGLGGCGKEGQYPLQTAYGGPHVRIRNVVVGGK